MTRPVRILFIITGITACLCLALAAAASFWLSAWVPTKGKAWLESELAQQTPLDVRIGSLTYSVLDGIICDDVTAIDRQSHMVWFRAPSLSARVALLDLVMNRPIHYRIHAELAAPVKAVIGAEGRYGLRDRRGALEVSADSILLETLSAPLKERMPGLQGGAATLKVLARWQPGTAPDVSGRFGATHVLWRLDGIQGLDTTEEISGSFRLIGDQLQIERIEGRTGGMPWDIEGTIGPLANPSIDARVRIDVDLAKAAAAAPAPIQALRPAGAMHVVAALRGGFSAWPMMEIMAAGDLADASLTLTQLPQRLEHVTGRIGYDYLAREIRIESLEGRAADHRWSAHGGVLLASPPLLDMTLQTTGDVGLAQTLLPSDGPVQSVSGPAMIQLTLSGPATQPQWQGQAEFRGAAVALRTPPTAIKDITGTVTFSASGAHTKDLQLSLQGVPVRLDAAVTDMAAGPHITGTVTFPQGSFWTDARIRQDQLEITRADLRLARSQLRFIGRVGLGGTSSDVQMSGVVDLVDLTDLPAVDTRSVNAWALTGPVTVQAQVRGPLREWRELDLLGSAACPRLSVRGIPAQDVTMQWQQHAGVLKIALTQATLAGGRVTANGFAELKSAPAKFSADADATSLDLSQAAALIPAWRERQITGTASTHAEVSGSPGDQAGWRGSGWVNMAGEQLGDVPLLDRVFHGVFGALADRLGLMDLRRAKLTKVSGQWRLTQGRIVTDDLQLSGSAGAEPIVIMLRGSVGLDRTLDLTVEPDLPEQLILEAPNTSSLGRTILKVMGGAERMRQMIGRHHLGGTIDKPEYKFEFSLEQLLREVLPGGFGQLLEGIR